MNRQPSMMRCCALVLLFTSVIEACSKVTWFDAVRSGSTDVVTACIEGNIADSQTNISRTAQLVRDLTYAFHFLHTVSPEVVHERDEAGWFPPPNPLPNSCESRSPILITHRPALSVTL